MPLSIRFRLNPTGPAPYLLQYTISVDGKESRRIGLVLDSARQYFIDCERLLSKAAPQRVETAPVQLSRKELALMVVQIEEEKEALERKIAADQPKVAYVEAVLDTPDCVVTTVIAGELGLSAVKFNQLLKDRGIQWKVDGIWVLTSRYAGRGYTQMRTHVYYEQGVRRTAMFMVWTQRGRAMLHYLFRKQKQLQFE